MKIISLGGIGGCELAQALRNLNQPAYPYDWLLTTQTFIINSFNNFNNFFIFDKTYIYDNTKLLSNDKKAIMLHDFDNFDSQKEIVIEKYKRRFERLNECLNSNEDILFVRIYDNLQEKLNPNDYYNNILIRDEEDVEKWSNFIKHIQIKYNKKIELLLITNIENICSKTYNGIIIYFTKEYKNNKFIYHAIKDTIKSKF